MLKTLKTLFKQDKEKFVIPCNSVLNPGSVIGRRASIYPTSSVRGVVPEDCIYKAADNVVKRS